MNDRAGPPAKIVCVECGGVAHLLSTPPPDEGFEPGDFVAYRCADCLERLDLVYEIWDENPDANG
ncbi:MAG: hypothetical protein OEO77_02230 [Acidimicrobiia bacterium]|nr:hypothetical protein [Acidimicrobiia bacterium]